MANKTRKAGRGKKYSIHDNGGRPFEVIVAGSNITVMMNMDDFEIKNGQYTTIKNPPKQIFKVDAKEVFIGKKSPTGGYDGLKPSQAEGNSILLGLGGNKYRFIGWDIYDFTTLEGDKIIKYYSDIGNNDVPYPFAVGEKYIYFLTEKVAVPIELFNFKEDMYHQYYRRTQKGYDEYSPEFVKKHVKKLKVKIVQKRKI
jgi:hypothetical protein